MKPYLKVSGLIFLVVGILHLLRLVNHWEIAFNGGTVPMWVSIAGLPVAFGLAFWAWRLSRGK
jgi:uncharacterized membrane protein